MPTVPEDTQNITALLLGRVGDLLVSAPFLRALKTRYPKARLRLITWGSVNEAARLIPYIDEIALVHKGPRCFTSLATAAKILVKSCDLMIDLNPSFSRLGAGAAILIRSEVKLAFDKGRWNRIFTHRVAAPAESEPMRERYRRLAQALGAPYDPAATIELRVGREDHARADEILARIGWNTMERSRSRILIHPGNFKKFDNRWPERKFVELTRRLLKEPRLDLCYLAGPGEENEARAILKELPTPLPLISSAPMGPLALVMKQAELCVLNITGTTHLAAAAGAPTFSFYSGYTNAVWRPQGEIHGGLASSRWDSCRDIPVDKTYEALQAHLKRLEAAGIRRSGAAGDLDRSDVQ